MGDYSEYDVVLLATKDAMDRYWGKCVPILDRVVDEAMCGEMTTEDMRGAILEGRMQCFVCKYDGSAEEPDVGLVLVTEAVVYPRFTTMNIVAIGGRALGAFADKFWEYIKGWCYMNGARFIEALTSPAMTRVLSGPKFGFTPVYTKIRLGL